MFDDTDPEQTAYLGIADVPLIPLAHDKGVQGLFELKGPSGRINGCVEVELRWQFTYMPPTLKHGTTTGTKQVRTVSVLRFSIAVTCTVISLTLSQTSPGFYVSPVQVF